MKQIGIDCRFAGTHTGLGQYTDRIVQSLLVRHDNTCYTLFVRSLHDPWIRTLPVGAAVQILEAPFDHYTVAEQLRFPRLLSQSGIALLFVPHFNAPIFSPVPIVCTIHDLILHRYPNTSSLLRQCAYRVLMRCTLERARSIIAVSEFTKREIADIYGDRIARKVTRIYEGVDERFAPSPPEVQQAIRDKYALHRPYFLYVGNAKQHKQVPLLLEAFASMDRPAFDLVLLTHGREVHSLTLPDRVIIREHADAMDMPALYSAAVAFVSASSYEGFGLPFAEARACGCPVVGIRGTAIEEVAGAYAQLVQPTPDALRNGMLIVLEQQQEPSPLHFSWEEAAEETAIVFVAS